MSDSFFRCFVISKFSNKRLTLTMHSNRCVLLLLLLHFVHVFTINSCFQEKKHLKFYKIRSCYKSTLPIISWKHSDDVQDCIKFARDKNGLAFNFVPPELDVPQNRRMKSCEVLGCPEISNSSTIVFNPSYDYYSAYGDLNATTNATCIKSLGLFKLVSEKLNYTSAVEQCQNLGADLADILSESRTNTLATLLKSLKNWYKAAYVGLDDIGAEGQFENPMGNSLHCIRFRAWAVGHPRPGRQKEDCVILDADRTWRAINCKVRLGCICEFYPAAPPSLPFVLKYKNCTEIKSKSKRQQCKLDNEFFELYNSSSRIDQCALLNDFEYE